MDSESWERVQILFHEVVDRPAGERLIFLQIASGGDEELIANVQALLEEDARDSLLDRDLADIAAPMFGPEASSPTTFPEFGPYRIRSVLGEGGMGVVYLAEREDLGSQAAIKILRDAWMSPARRERFAIEQRTLAQLAHRSIARLYDADTLPDGTPWFAMEYVEGIPITEYCRRHGSSVEERLAMLGLVCEAVRYAHSRAVIHRDLKPANMLVQQDGNVKLLDFGIAKQIGTNDTPANQTRAGLELMTPAYAAPEQIRGEAAGTYTDVYALGVILFELLTGQLPFTAESAVNEEATFPATGRVPEKPSVVVRRQTGGSSPKGCWADLDVMCLTAMHPDGERRYRSVEALIRDIEHYSAGEPLEARRDTMGYRVGKFVRRNRHAVIAVAIALVTLAALVIGYTVRLKEARNTALAEAARTQRILRFTLNLFYGGDQESGPASDLRVATVLDRGVVEARSLDRDPAVQAELYETLGEVYQKLGVLDRADSLLSLALQKRRALFGWNHQAVAESLLKLGLLRSDQARFGDAERLVREGLQITRGNQSESHAAVGAALNGLGKVLEDRGSYGDAIQVLQEAVRVRSMPGADQGDLAASLLELANAHFYAGHYAQSESLNERLLTMHSNLYGKQHPLVAEDLINLGAIQQELGRYKEAETFQRRALVITEAYYGEDHYKTALNLTLIGRALIKQNRYDEAVKMIQKALVIQEKVFGKAHPRVASPLNELATIALRRGRFDEAEADFRRMIDIYRSAYAGKHYLIGVALANLGSVYLARKDNVRAEPLFRDALAMYAETLPPGNLNEGITRIKLGRALLRQSRFSEAEAETLAGYRTLSKQASPSVTWLHSAREDLAAIYVALGKPEKAKEFFDEEAAVGRSILPATADVPGAH